MPKHQSQTAKTIDKPLNVPQAIAQAFDLHRQGRLPEAAKRYAEILGARPDHFDALHMLGLIKLQHGELAEALRLMAAALRAKPKSTDAILNFGLVLNALNRHAEALISFDRVLELKPKSAEAYNNRGSVLNTLGRDEEALASYRQALAIKPDYAQALFNQGIGLAKLARHEEALQSLDRAVALKPNYAVAHHNRGKALHTLGRYAQAIESFDSVLKGNPDRADVLHDRGNALIRLGRHTEALENYRRATALNPAFVDAQWDEGLTLLRLGEFSAGWEKYEWRLRQADAMRKQRFFAQPAWRGIEPLQGKTILLHPEQGLGDTIQFARYAAPLAERGARVILQVPRPLKNLLAQIAGAACVIGHDEEPPAFDLHCPLLSLPRALQTELDSIPANVPYIVAETERIESWSRRLPPRGGRRVGLVWSGNATHTDDRNRSIALDRLAPLFDAPGVQFFGVQRDLRDDDAQALRNAPGMLDLGRQLDDFADTAALIANLDLVIAVDTSVAHLAGALGKPVWILLPFCPDWRWLLEREDSPWYPSARLFRQPSAGDWNGVIEGLRAALVRHAALA